MDDYKLNSILESRTYDECSPDFAEQIIAKSEKIEQKTCLYTPWVTWMTIGSVGACAFVLGIWVGLKYPSTQIINSNEPDSDSLQIAEQDKNEYLVFDEEAPIELEEL
ncbi:MAG: hypothetical protein KBD64_03415 [Gammaproteobacteria bacterium]|nr:hypothetical protein [Gammaproteobacteria bacterium]